MVREASVGNRRKSETINYRSVTLYYYHFTAIMLTCTIIWELENVAKASFTRHISFRYLHFIVLYTWAITICIKLLLNLLTATSSVRLRKNLGFLLKIVNCNIPYCSITLTIFFQMFPMVIEILNYFIFAFRHHYFGIQLCQQHVFKNTDAIIRVT